MEYKIVYSGRKTLGLSIRSGELTVRAPYGYSKIKIANAVKDHMEWIEKHMLRSAKKEERENALSENDIKALKADSKRYFSEKCEYYALVMGLSYNRITITSAKGRFGSCSSKKNICFSYRLMLYPEAAREYVVVHELAHLCQMNHSKKFYEVVEKYLPDYKKRRELLKEK